MAGLLESFDDAIASCSSTPALRRRLVGGALFAPDGPAVLDIGATGLIAHSDGLCSAIYRKSLLVVPPPWPARSSGSRQVETALLAGAEAYASEVDKGEGVDGWVCIKRVQLDEQPRPHSIERELALLALLPPHRNIVPLLAAFEDTTDPFGEQVDLVLPLYPATLDEVLREPSLAATPTAVTENETSDRPGASLQHLWSGVGCSRDGFMVEVARGVLGGLAFLHEHGVAHRDVKPANILLAHTGGVKLCDLGTAYTAHRLSSLLGADHPIREEAEAEGGGGRMVCQVGTGEFRAPELLFSPTRYDAYAIDVWATAVTLAHFLTPLIHVPASTTSVDDERSDWQKAFESNTHLASPTDSDGVFWQEDSPVVRSESGFYRKPLFEPERGDIGLASSIFALLGRPSSLDSWPEAQHFQPPLHRFPFPPSPGTGLSSTLPPHPLLHTIIAPALQLSASLRPTAAALLAALDTQPHQEE